MDWHSAVAGFDFLGGSSIKYLQVSCDATPEAAGIYILKRLQPTPVAFLAANPGGRFKGRDPTVSISRLEERWIPSADFVCIGKAGGNDQRATLRSRIRSFMQFGLGKPCSHWGRRCIWQLADAKALRAHWTVTHELLPGRQALNRGKLSPRLDFVNRLICFCLLRLIVRFANVV